jgi:GT2 family glycosyltransferase
MSAPPVTVLVLTWGRFDETVECLESLRRVRYAALHVLVVDNASGGDYVPRLQERFPEIEIVASPVNLGYAGGNNLGLRHAIAKGAAFVLVLNNDTVVDPDLVAALVAAAEKEPRIAAVGARVMQMENPDRVYCVGGHLTWNPPLIQLEGLDATAPEVSKPCDMGMVAGCAVLFRAVALRHIGFFDERFFAYHEDVDWCTRAREAGHRVVYEPTAVIHHRRAPIIARPRAEPYLYYFYGRNAILYAYKHANARQWTKLLATSVIWLAGSFFTRILRGEPPRRVAKTVFLIASGMVDGLARREVPFERLGLRRAGPVEDGDG